MYIFRNAWNSVTRSIPRNLIIGMIIFVISTASCIALSIEQSARAAREEKLNALEIEAHIKIDRKYVMQELQTSDMSDREAMAETLSALSGLDLEEMQKYAEASSVKDFYYYTSISMNGNEDLKPLSDSSESETTQAQQPTGRQNGPPGRGMQMNDPSAMLEAASAQGDFTLEGYISDRAMTDFYTGASTMTAGSMFPENTTEYVCVITDELATYNSLSLGDQITLCNPNNSRETFVFTILGIYENTSDDTTVATEASQDPGNTILTSSAVVQDIVDRSGAYNDPAEVSSAEKQADGRMVEQLLTSRGEIVIPALAEESADDESSETAGEDEGDAREERIIATVSGTYVFASMEDYDLFETQIRDMGLEEKYIVTSNDVATYEASLVPLDNLKAFAETFLYVILAIGCLVLIALNIFNIRERKFEIGVMTAIGMSKMKVAFQFTLELLIVTVFALSLGLLAGATSSVPITNSLLATQVSQTEAESSQKLASYGREVDANVTMPKGGDVEGEVDYVTTVGFSIDYQVIGRMAAMALALSILSSLITSLFIMRYNPLRILTERE